MAQTGFTPILIYSSSTTTNVPTAGNLTNSTLGSELAINITDGKLFYKDNSNAVQVIGWKVVPATAGGTGQTSYAVGDILYASTATVLSKLGIGSAYQALQVNAGGTAPSWQASATSTLTAQGDLLYASAANTLARLAKNTTASRYLSNGGTSNNPSWAQIDLSNGVTGTLPVGNGGTGITTLTAGYIPYGNGTSAFSSTANLFYGSTGLGVANNVLTSNGGNVLGAGSNIQFAANSASDGYGMAKIQGYLLGNGSPYGDYGNLDFYTKASGSVQLTRCVRFDNNGQAFFELASTTASAANAYLNNGSSPANQLLRSTSSARYKTDIEDLQTQYSQNIYKLRPIWYRSKATADRSDWSWFGLLAEEVALVEPRLVHWTYLPSDYETKDVEYRAITKDENGNTVEKIELVPEKVLKENAVKVPDGVQYERLSVLLLAEVQKLRAEVDELKRK